MPDLEPGPEMDLAVARAVGWRVAHGGLGYPWAERVEGESARPSTDVGDAIAALEETGCKVTIERDGPGQPWIVGLRGWICEGETFTEDSWHYKFGASLPVAACRAILAWAEAKETTQ